MTKFLFIRHAESVSNRSGCFCGQMDSPLSDLGLNQANDLGEYLANNYKIDKIFTSDLTRVKQTIAPIAQKLGIEPQLNANLREIDVGSWVGKTIEQIRDIDPEKFKRYKAGDTSVVMGGAECFDDVYVRVKKVVDKIASQCNGQTVIVASHGGAIRAVLRKWLNLSDVQMRVEHEIGNASVSEVDYDGQTAKVIVVGENGYLRSKTGDFSTKPFSE